MYGVLSVKRTKLRDRLLPDYTRGEEIFNMVSHIVGGAFGIAALATCVVKAFLNHDAYQIVGSFIYGFAMVLLYTVSSVYHGLIPEMAKKVMQVIDHCTIFILIAGTYTPIALTVLREKSAALGWTVFGIVWGVSALGITLNAIDLKKYNIFSIICYIALGWCIIFTGKTAIEAMGIKAFLWILAGGISYTVGAVLYAIAGRSVHRYMHSVFHIFVVLGSILQYIGIIFYILV
ncbi:MAG: hemolysin III family protein [Clostridia bacterium]|nr:hemolysin III family protein [Clostridia bacterium]